ncbi:hypothetical protein D3C78_993250 [compost metagenome]
MLGQFAADHQVDQLCAAVARHGLDAHQLAIAQHGDALGDALELFQAVRDVDDGHPTLLQAFDLGEQQLDLARGEHGRRLIENQHMAVADQVAGNFHHLLMADAQFADRGVRVDSVETDLSHSGPGLLTQALATDPAATAGQVVEKQVLGHGQGRQQVELLHDHAHAKTLGSGTAAGLVSLPLIVHLPGGRQLEAADDFRQGALARAVLASEGQYLAAIQTQLDITEHRLGVGFADCAD